MRRRQVGLQDTALSNRGNTRRKGGLGRIARQILKPHANPRPKKPGTPGSLARRPEPTYLTPFNSSTQRVADVPRPAAGDNA